MPNIEQEAQALKAWASQGQALNFQTAEFLENTKPESVRLFHFDINQKIALDILRKCKINVVAIAPGMTEIRIGVQKMPTQLQLSHLPNRTFSDYPIYKMRLMSHENWHEGKKLQAFNFKLRHYAEWRQVDGSLG